MLLQHVLTIKLLSVGITNVNGSRRGGNRRHHDCSVKRRDSPEIGFFWVKNPNTHTHRNKENRQKTQHKTPPTQSKTTKQTQQHPKQISPVSLSKRIRKIWTWKEILWGMGENNRGRTRWCLPQDPKGPQGWNS